MLPGGMCLRPNHAYDSPASMIGGLGVMSIGCGCWLMMRIVTPGDGASARPASSACDPSNALTEATIAIPFSLVSRTFRSAAVFSRSRQPHETCGVPHADVQSRPADRDSAASDTAERRPQHKQQSDPAVVRWDRHHRPTPSGELRLSHRPEWIAVVAGQAVSGPSLQTADNRPFRNFSVMRCQEIPQTNLVISGNAR